MENLAFLEFVGHFFVGRLAFFCGGGIFCEKFKRFGLFLQVI